MQVKDVCQGIGNIPSFRQARRDVEMGVTGEQVVEDEIVDALGLRFQTHPGIEVGGTALDDHYQGVGVGFAGAGEGECEESRNSKKTWRLGAKYRPTQGS